MPKAKPDPEPVFIDAGDARSWWSALVGNVVTLLDDAALLLEAGSAGRACSLVVLAEEELAKAVWLYDAAESAWDAGSGSVQVPAAITGRGQARHEDKLVRSQRYDEGLDMFWGDYTGPLPDGGWPGDAETWRAVRDATDERHADTAKVRNGAKQRGFYVDRHEDGTVTSPQDVDSAEVGPLLQRVAGRVEMMLISDHTRMKASGGPYDSTHDLQRMLLPLSHPDLFKEQAPPTDT